MGQQFDPHVLELIKKMQVILPPEPIIIVEADGSVSKMEEIKNGKKHD
jgi:pentose-5-phosphate-3-epimerase